MLAPDALKWQEAINKEGQALDDNGTWKLVERPSGKKVLTSMWVLKIKRNSDGTIERYKARLVVRGCFQVKGIDFDEIFAPVVRLESLRVLLAITCIEDLECEQMDIETAFLNGECKEEVYMEQPQGLVKPGMEHLVCKLVKSLYGLKQAPRAWHKALTDFLVSIGFNKLFSDPCIYMKLEKEEKQIIAIYVDDLLLITKSVETMRKMKASIGAKFKAKTLGSVNFILGLKVTRDRQARKLWINQEQHAKSILEKFNFSHCKPVDTPTWSQRKLEKGTSILSQDKPYRQLIGSLMYLMVGSRPDIAYAVQDVSQFLNCYDKSHWEAGKRILRYIQGTSSVGLEYSGERVILGAYADSDYASSTVDRKSVSGYITKIGNCVITWSSRKQRTVAQSTAEAEYISLAHCTREVLFLRQLLGELGYEQSTTEILDDNQACISMAENPVQHSRTKHIDVRYHFIRERVKNKEVKVKYVESKENVADILTKGLERPAFQYLFKIMGLNRVNT
jgi:hypothetical protein